MADDTELELNAGEFYQPDEKDDELHPCTCTLACEPRGITDEQFCRLRGEQ